MIILSLNVWGGQRHDDLLSFIEARRESVDVFCLQEMFTNTVEPNDFFRNIVVLDLAEQLKDVLPNHTLALGPSRDTTGEQLAFFVANQLPILKQEQRQLYKRRDLLVHPGLPEESVYLLAITVKTASHPLAIAQLHGYWEKDQGEDKPPRDEQITKTLEFVEAQHTPVVLCGDFNMNTKTRGITRVTEKLRNLTQEHGITSTRPQSNPYRDTVGDYMFVSPELAVKSFAVLPDVVSDHLPLLVEVE